MKQIAIAIIVTLLVFSLAMVIFSAKGYDLSAIDQWSGLAAWAAVSSGCVGGVFAAYFQGGVA